MELLTWLRETNARDATDHQVGSSHSFCLVLLRPVAVR